MSKKSRKQIVSYGMAAVMAAVMWFWGGSRQAYAVSGKKLPALSAAEMVMEVGQKKTLKLRNYKRIGKKKVKNVKWSTSNKKVAAVKASGNYRQEGKVTARKQGKATITLKFGGKTYKCKVTVKKRKPEAIRTTEKPEEQTATEKGSEDKPGKPAVTEKPEEQTAADKPNEEKPGEQAPVDKPEEHPACFHIWDGGVIVSEATCGEEGVQAFTCTVCGNTEEKRIPKTESHTYNSGVVAQEATCGNEGVRMRTCIICGSKKAERIPKTDRHIYDGTYTADYPGTYTEKGKKSQHCTVCGKTDGQYVEDACTDTYKKCTEINLNAEKWGPANPYYLGSLSRQMERQVIAYIHGGEYYTVLLTNLSGYLGDAAFQIAICKGIGEQFVPEKLQILRYSEEEARRLYSECGNGYMESRYEYWEDKLTADKCFVIDNEGVLGKKGRLFVSSELVYKILWQSDYRPDYNVGFRNLSIGGGLPTQIYKIE